ncbi:MAG TPA: hypothetical protein VGH59_11245 [Casimicrobiaceae bacterium]
MWQRITPCPSSSAAPRVGALADAILLRPPGEPAAAASIPWMGHGTRGGPPWAVDLAVVGIGPVAALMR